MFLYLMDKVMHKENKMCKSWKNVFWDDLLTISMNWWTICEHLLMELNHWQTLAIQCVKWGKVLRMLKYLSKLKYETVAGLPNHET